MFQKTRFTEIFNRIWKPKNQDLVVPTQHPQHDQERIYESKDIKFPKRLGKNNGMYLYLQEKVPNKPFKIVIHDPTMVPNLHESGLDIEPGRLSIITVTPQQVMTNQDLGSNSESERDCRFNYEAGTMKLFKEYHQE